MAARNLLTAEMMTVSERWTSAKSDRGLLGAIPLLAAMLPMIDAAHAALLDAQRVDEGADSVKELAALSAEGGETDQRHDRKGRGVWKVLDGLADLADSPEESDGYAALRDRFMPDGQSILQASWATESGNAQRLEKELRDDTFSRALAEVPLPGRKATLLDAVKAHISAGRRLGVIEARRGVIEAELKVTRAARAADGATSALVKARNQWIRVVNAIVANLDLVTDLTDDVRAQIVGPYLRIEQAADRRASARRTAGSTEPADPVAPKPA
jgi:hypothetical protein